jgi:hypothetical protein
MGGGVAVHADPPLRLLRVRHQVASKERLAFTKRPKKNPRVDLIQAYLRRLDRYTMQLVFKSVG